VNKKIISGTARRLLWKSLPYLASALAGLVLFYISKTAKSPTSDLLVNIAAALLAVPLLFLIYEVAKSASERKLRKKLFDDAKVRIDTEMLSSVNQIMKLIVDYRRCKFSFPAITVLLKAKEAEVESMFAECRYAGFQVFKQWSTTIKNLRKLLDSASVNRVLNDEQMIAVVDVLNRLEELDRFTRNTSEIFVASGDCLEGHKATDGREFDLSSEGALPDRLLLLKDLGDGTYQVVDFGDFARGHRSDLLKMYSVNPKLRSEYSSRIWAVLNGVAHWSEITDSEFIVDERVFRANPPKSRNL